MHVGPCVQGHFSCLDFHLPRLIFSLIVMLHKRILNYAGGYHQESRTAIKVASRLGGEVQGLLESQQEVILASYRR
jgi:hypothetical protein